MVTGNRDCRLYHHQTLETIYQTDRVIENAYEFIEEICNVVGYVASEDEEE
jgi:hypothetical protein